MRGGKLAATDQDASAIAFSSGSDTPNVVVTLSSHVESVPIAGRPDISAPVVFGVPAPDIVIRPPNLPPRTRPLLPIRTPEPVFAHTAATAGGTSTNRRASAATCWAARRMLGPAPSGCDDEGLRKP